MEKFFFFYEKHSDRWVVNYYPLMKMNYSKVLQTLIFVLIGGLSSYAQSSISGTLQDSNSDPVIYANVALYQSIDSSLVKVETSNETGYFILNNIALGNYFLKATFIGLPELEKTDLIIASDNVELGVLSFSSQTIGIEEVNITAERAMVVVEPDRTVFNVEGTINSTGSDAISLLRKAPAVVVDNNDNINVLGRSGVRVYIDGKELPLSGDDLSSYLKNLSADQIDRIEIITSPGAKYEAEGNAGIIDIRLKKDKNVGAYGALSGTLTQGELTRYNINGNGNYRNKKMNVFGAVGYNVNDNFHNINYESYQNGLFLDEINNTRNDRDITTYRIGTDFYLNKTNTIGFLVGGRLVSGEETSYNRIAISDQVTQVIVDSVLIAKNDGVNEKTQNTYNLNYRYAKDDKQSVTIDLDYGNYLNTNFRHQPNQYYNDEENILMSEKIHEFDTPNDILIYTAKLDYERGLGKGKLSLGGKYGQVETSNVFKVFDIIDGVSLLDDTLSNEFDYSENVTAGYVSYGNKLGEKVSFTAGVRGEYTKTQGELTTFIANLEEEPSKSEYMSWFPSAGLTWNVKEKHALSLNYGRRINRPDYNVLNPFRTQLSELSISKGNPFLKPEIVNNYELGYTLAYRYNFKIAYSKTTDKITRLIGPDDSDPRAGFISWDNLASESVVSFNASLPFEVKKWWDAYFNIGMSHIDNQADYGDGGVVDIQVFTYSVYQQSTFKLPKGFKGELSGYYSGPGVWGGVFKYDANWTLDLGLQKEFLDKKLRVKVSANNIFNRIGWQGTSEFNGLVSSGNGMWDSRFVSLSVKYSFGNSNVKSRKRKTGLESESKRVK